MNELKYTANDFIEIIGSALHYFENINELDLDTCTAKEITDMREGWLHRYQNESLFHNKVESIVANLMKNNVFTELTDLREFKRITQMNNTGD